MSSATRSRIVLFAATLALLFAVFPLAPAHAESTGVIPPPPSGGGSGSGGGRYDCGSTTDRTDAGAALWMKGTYDNNGVYQSGWVLLLEESPLCGGGTFPIRDADDSTVTYLDCPVGETCRDTVTYANRSDCTDYFEVYRFYGPPSNPTQYMSVAAADALTPCQTGEYFRFFTPNPRDAGVSPGAPFSTTWRYTTAQRSISSQGCPVPDDNANIEAFFSTTWETEEEADLAAQFRKAFGDAYMETLAKTSHMSPALPRSVTNSFFNSSGTMTYPGDDFVSVNYPDNLPCSSGLDFAVRSDAAAAPWVFGVCFVPVRTMYSGYSVNGTDDTVYTKRLKLSRTELGHYPYYDVNWAQQQVASAPRDAITNAYRSRLSGSLGVDHEGYYPEIHNAAEVANDVPCYWGQGAVVNQVNVQHDLEPVDPPIVSGPPDHLAYVGGLATRQEFSYSPQPLTCNGGNRCTQGQTMVSINYTPSLSVPSGWTACTGSNRSSCDYKIDYSQHGFRLDVELETYTATRPGEAITFTPSATVVIEYPGPESESWLTIDLPRTWAWQDVGLAQIDISASDLPENRVTIGTVPIPTRIPVAGSRLTTER